MELVTVRLTGNYSEEWQGNNAKLKFDTGDTLNVCKSKYKKIIRNLKYSFLLTEISEIIQKKATQTQIRFKSGDSVTVNSKYGIRLFKYLNNDDFD